jgi:signal transduction histidine kinase/ligand-binding sensor domain-containing protein/DNA-binding response OmpR family regulator
MIPLSSKQISFKRSFLLLWLFTVMANGASVDLNPRFTHFSSDDGLSQSNVTCIIEDRQGFIWFGTFNGLNRYDAHSFESFHYTPEGANGLSHNYISALAVDDSGFIWIGTLDGLNRFNPVTQRFSVFHPDSQDKFALQDNQIESILIDRQARLWVGTRNGGLALRNAQSKQFYHFRSSDDDSSSLSDNFVRALFEDRQGNIWIAHRNGSIDIIPNGEKKPQPLFSDHKRLTDDRISAITQTKDGAIWIGTQGDGLFRLFFENGQTERLRHLHTDNFPLSSNIILSLRMDRDGRLWIGTEDQGIILLDPESEDIGYIKNDPFNGQSLTHNSVWSIYEDRQGNIWIGLYGFGINLYCRYQSDFHHYRHHPNESNSLSHNMVNAFSEDAQGRLWIATDGGGVNCWNPQTQQFITYNSKNSPFDADIAVSLYFDGSAVWIGTWLNGLYRLDLASESVSHFSAESHGLGSNRIMNIISDGKDGLWLASFWGGITHLHSASGAVKVYNVENSGLSDNNTRVLLQDYDNKLWIGSDLALDCFDPATGVWENFLHNPADSLSISKGFVNAIFQNSDSIIWVGASSGLNQFQRENRSFIHYTRSNGLPNDEIKAILGDEQTRLWISTNAGISSFEVLKGEFLNYDVSDGLQGNEFNSRSAWHSGSGALLFGGNNGFNLFYPQKLQTNPIPPAIHITELSIYNQPVAPGTKILPRHISFTNAITLTYRENVFAFKFTALNFLAPEKNRYRYRLLGFDEKWIESRQQSAVFTNIGAGNYLFQVIGANNNGVWNETPREIAIKITPPFWETGWAYLIYFLIAATLVAFVANHYITKLRLQNKLKMEHLQLEKMFESDQMKSRFFANITHEFYSPITLILSPLERLMRQLAVEPALKKHLAMVLRNARRLHRMVEQLKDIQKAERGELRLNLAKGDLSAFIENLLSAFQEYAADRKIHLEFITSLSHPVIWFDADKLDKILYNLLSNAFKYTPDEGKVQIILEKSAEDDADTGQRHFYRIIVRDNGLGIPREQLPYIFNRYYRAKSIADQADGSGIGLAFVNELIQICNWDISVESEPQQGTAFTVIIPADNEVYEPGNAADVFGEFYNGDEPVYAEIPNTENSVTAREVPLLLIAEDDQEIRQYLEQSLSAHYRLIVSRDGEDALQQARSAIPDLLVSDIKMPKKDGLILCAELRRDEKTSHIPVILLTAYTSEEIHKKGLSTGADAYLKKPFDIDLLELQIQNLLKNRQELREKYRREMLLQPAKPAPENLDEKFLLRLVKIIEEHISEGDFNAELLAHKAGLSRVQLYRKLRSLTDQTAHEFIASIRLQRAVQLLQEKKMTITEVAFAVGYNDLTYFARSFKKKYQVSPSEFRKKN